MTIAPGARLGSYEILAPLGARDPRLARDVAIKVLPEEFFEGIPSSSSSSSRHLLVMELVEGDDLAARIATGPLSLRDVTCS